MRVCRSGFSPVLLLLASKFIFCFFIVFKPDLLLKILLYSLIQSQDNHCGSLQNMILPSLVSYSIFLKVKSLFVIQALIVVKNVSLVRFVFNALNSSKLCRWLQVLIIEKHNGTSVICALNSRKFSGSWISLCVEFNVTLFHDIRNTEQWKAF